MAGSEQREIVVIGAGVVGLSTSRALGLLGRDVVCLEQARVGHEWSGSKGNSRAFRVNHDEPVHNAMAIEAARGWKALESASGQQILKQRVFLNFGEDLASYAAGLLGAGGAAELLGASEVAERFPGLAISGPAVLEPTAGMLRVDSALEALRSTMTAELREGVEVLSLADAGEKVRVETSNGDLERVVSWSAPEPLRPDCSAASASPTARSRLCSKSCT